MFSLYCFRLNLMNSLLCVCPADLRTIWVFWCSSFFLRPSSCFCRSFSPSSVSFCRSSESTKKQRPSQQRLPPWGRSPRSFSFEFWRWITSSFVSSTFFQRLVLLEILTLFALFGFKVFSFQHAKHLISVFSIVCSLKFFLSCNVELYVCFSLFFLFKCIFNDFDIFNYWFHSLFILRAAFWVSTSTSIVIEVSGSRQANLSCRIVT